MTYASGRRCLRGGAVAPGASGSALTFRPDAMLGFTGFTPDSMCVPTTRHTKVTERGAAPSLAEQKRAAAAAEEGHSGGTTYGSAYQTDPAHDWLAGWHARPPAAAATSLSGQASGQAFCGRTTYQAELMWKDASDVNVTSGRGCPGGAAERCSPQHLPASGAAQPGYLTTAAASQLAMQQRLACPSQCDSGSAPAGGGRHSWHSRRARPAATATATATPEAGRAAPWADDPPTPPEPRAAPSTTVLPLGRRKEDAAVYSLNQHSRGRLPGYTGHQPQHGAALEPPPPTSLTTWGAASLQALRRPPPAPDATHAIDSRKGLLSFFSAGAHSEFVSENGLAEAARFHGAARPLEGRMRVPQASRTAPRGAKFTA